MRILTGALILALGLAVVNRTAAAQAGTPAEQLDMHMKGVQKQMGALMGAIKGGTLADVAAPAKGLQTTFAEVEKIFAAAKKDDAVKLAKDAQAGFAGAAAAAAAGDAAKAQMEAGNAQATCKQCHGLYREGMPGAYTVKAGVL